MIMSFINISFNNTLKKACLKSTIGALMILIHKKNSPLLND